MSGKGRGWVTAEYGMLPASTGQRKQRDVTKGRPDGRTVEIQRLIGRSLRGVVDYEALGERTIWIDCDVLEADGGTRCAAITGGYVALHLALALLVAEGALDTLPLTQSVAAVSCGVVDGSLLLDLDYPEDSSAEVDMNVVMTGDGGLVEVQATAERTPLSKTSLDEMLALGAAGIDRLRAAQAASRARCPARRPTPAEPRVRLLLASSSAHKLRELGALLRPHELEPVPPEIELGPETESTFAGNARLKAHRAARATGRIALADDSGIEAAALGGAPGVRSARFAGEHASDEENLRRLLVEVPPGGDRRARYVCALVVAAPDGADWAFEATCDGVLATEPRGPVDSATTPPSFPTTARPDARWPSSRRRRRTP